MPKGAKYGGRKKGTPNKVTADIKAMVLQALDELGGVEYLKEQAQDNSSSFISLLGKILPTQLNHSGMIAQTHDEFLKQAKQQLESEGK